VQYTDANGDFDKDGFNRAKFAWKEDYKGMKFRMDKYNQCSPKLKNKLEGTSGYDNVKSSNDIIKLLMIIRGYSCQFDTLNDEYMLIVKLLKNLFYFFQKPDQTNSEFNKDFMALVKVIEEYGGTRSLTHFPNMIKKELLSKNIKDPSKALADDLKEAKCMVREKFLAALMLNGANASKYGELKCSMTEKYVTGMSEFPESPEVVLRILNAYQPPARWNINQRKQEAGTGTNKGAMFAQTDNDNWKADIEGYTCGEKGHLAWERTKKKTKEAEQMHMTIAEEEGQDLDKGENILVQSGTRRGVNRSYVLLDNKITVNQIANHNLLDNFRKTKKPITIHCNNGSSYTNLEGDLGGMTMHHNPFGIANVCH